MKDRRGYYRRGLHPVYLPYYDGLCGLLPICWQPTWGRRTFQEQADLFALGRTVRNPQGIVTWSKPGLSYHNYGLASDWDYFDGEEYTPLVYGSDIWKEYIDACQKVGVRYLQSERPHNEYPLVSSIQVLLKAWNQGGIMAVDEALRRSHGPISIGAVPVTPGYSEDPSGDGNLSCRVQAADGSDWLARETHPISNR